MRTYIYILQDPDNQEVRYVGKTVHLKQRYNHHINSKMLKRKKCYLSSWLLSLMNKGQKPIFTVIDETDSPDWEWLEQYWISQFKQWDFKLTNLAEGGQGGNSYKRSESTKALISKNNGRGRAIVTEDDVRLTRKLLSEGLKCRAIRKQIPNMKPSILYNIKHNLKWKHVK